MTLLKLYHVVYLLYLCSLGNANALKKKRTVKSPRKSFEDVLTENFRNEKTEINKPSKSKEIKSESQDEERSDLDDDLFDFPNSSQSFSTKSIYNIQI